ncbi:hypothetical protein Ciccas_003258 [Cichlidogyrus casuarinus]|uniref:Beta-1,3-glucan-binding protein n=1 Tax=Cichlidogyrus casuarinus TaxID=1844966 RepID=A0ABD2QH61_9PLAT
MTLKQADNNKKRYAMSHVFEVHPINLLSDLTREFDTGNEEDEQTSFREALAPQNDVISKVRAKKNQNSIFSSKSDFIRNEVSGSMVFRFILTNEEFEMVGSLQPKVFLLGAELENNPRYSFVMHAVNARPQALEYYQRLVLDVQDSYTGSHSRFGFNSEFEIVRLKLDMIGFVHSDRNPLELSAIFEVQNAFVQKSIDGAVHLKTPFPGHSSYRLGFNGIGQLYYVMANAIVSWGDSNPHQKADIAIIYEPKSGKAYNFEFSVVPVAQPWHFKVKASNHLEFDGTILSEYLFSVSEHYTFFARFSGYHRETHKGPDLQVQVTILNPFTPQLEAKIYHKGTSVGVSRYESGVDINLYGHSLQGSGVYSLSYSSLSGSSLLEATDGSITIRNSFIEDFDKLALKWELNLKEWLAPINRWSPQMGKFHFKLNREDILWLETKSSINMLQILIDQPEVDAKVELVVASDLFEQLEAVTTFHRSDQSKFRLKIEQGRFNYKGLVDFDNEIQNLDLLFKGENSYSNLLDHRIQLNVKSSKNGTKTNAHANLGISSDANLANFFFILDRAKNHAVLNATSKFLNATVNSDKSSVNSTFNAPGFETELEFDKGSKRNIRFKLLYQDMLNVFYDLVSESDGEFKSSLDLKYLENKLSLPLSYTSENLLGSFSWIELDREQIQLTLEVINAMDWNLDLKTKYPELQDMFVLLKDSSFTLKETSFGKNTLFALQREQTKDKLTLFSAHLDEVDFQIEKFWSAQKKEINLKQKNQLKFRIGWQKYENLYLIFKIDDTKAIDTRLTLTDSDKTGFLFAQHFRFQDIEWNTTQSGFYDFESSAYEIRSQVDDVYEFKLLAEPENSVYVTNFRDEQQKINLAIETDAEKFEILSEWPEGGALEMKSDRNSKSFVLKWPENEILITFGQMQEKIKLNFRNSPFSWLKPFEFERSEKRRALTLGSLFDFSLDEHNTLIGRILLRKDLKFELAYAGFKKFLINCLDEQEMRKFSLTMNEEHRYAWILFNSDANNKILLGLDLKGSPILVSQRRILHMDLQPKTLSVFDLEKFGQKIESLSMVRLGDGITLELKFDTVWSWVASMEMMVPSIWGRKHGSLVVDFHLENYKSFDYSVLLKRDSEERSVRINCSPKPEFLFSIDNRPVLQIFTLRNSTSLSQIEDMQGILVARNQDEFYLLNKVTKRTTDQEEVEINFFITQETRIGHQTNALFKGRLSNSETNSRISIQFKSDDQFYFSLQNNASHGTEIVTKLPIFDHRVLKIPPLKEARDFTELNLQIKDSENRELQSWTVFYRLTEEIICVKVFENKTLNPETRDFLIFGEVLKSRDDLVEGRFEVARYGKLKIEIVGVEFDPNPKVFHKFLKMLLNPQERNLAITGQFTNTNEINNVFAVVYGPEVKSLELDLPSLDKDMKANLTIVDMVEEKEVTLLLHPFGFSGRYSASPIPELKVQYATPATESRFEELFSFTLKQQLHFQVPLHEVLSQPGRKLIFSGSIGASESHVALDMDEEVISLQIGNVFLSNKVVELLWSNQFSEIPRLLIKLEIGAGELALNYTSEHFGSFYSQFRTISRSKLCHYSLLLETTMKPFKLDCEYMVEWDKKRLKSKSLVSLPGLKTIGFDLEVEENSKAIFSLQTLSGNIDIKSGLDWDIEMETSLFTSVKHIRVNSKLIPEQIFSEYPECNTQIREFVVMDVINNEQLMKIFLAPTNCLKIQLPDGLTLKSVFSMKSPVLLLETQTKEIYGLEVISRNNTIAVSYRLPEFFPLSRVKLLYSMENKSNRFLKTVTVSSPVHLEIRRSTEREADHQRYKDNFRFDWPDTIIFEIDQVHAGDKYTTLKLEAPSRNLAMTITDQLHASAARFSKLESNFVNASSIWSKDYRMFNLTSEFFRGKVAQQVGTQRLTLECNDHEFNFRNMWPQPRYLFSHSLSNITTVLLLENSSQKLLKVIQTKDSWSKLENQKELDSMSHLLEMKLIADEAQLDIRSAANEKLYNNLVQWKPDKMLFKLSFGDYDSCEITLERNPLVITVTFLREGKVGYQLKQTFENKESHLEFISSLFWDNTFLDTFYNFGEMRILVDKKHFWNDSSCNFSLKQLKKRIRRSVGLPGSSPGIKTISSYDNTWNLGGYSLDLTRNSSSTGLLISYNKKELLGFFSQTSRKHKHDFELLFDPGNLFGFEPLLLRTKTKVQSEKAKFYQLTNEFFAREILILALECFSKTDEIKGQTLRFAAYSDLMGTHKLSMTKSNSDYSSEIFISDSRYTIKLTENRLVIFVPGYELNGERTGSTGMTTTEFKFVNLEDGSLYELQVEETDQQMIIRGFLNPDESSATSIKARFEKGQAAIEDRLVSSLIGSLEIRDSSTGTTHHECILHHHVSLESGFLLLGADCSKLFKFKLKSSDKQPLDLIYHTASNRLNCSVKSWKDCNCRMEANNRFWEIRNKVANSNQFEASLITPQNELNLMRSLEKNISISISGREQENQIFKLLIGENGGTRDVSLALYDRSWETQVNENSLESTIYEQEKVWANFVWLKEETNNYYKLERNEHLVALVTNGSNFTAEYTQNGKGILDIKYKALDEVSLYFNATENSNYGFKLQVQIPKIEVTFGNREFELLRTENDKIELRYTNKDWDKLHLQAGFLDGGFVYERAAESYLLKWDAYRSSIQAKHSSQIHSATEFEFILARLLRIYLPVPDGSKREVGFEITFPQKESAFPFRTLVLGSKSHNIFLSFQGQIFRVNVFNYIEAEARLKNRLVDPIDSLRISFSPQRNGVFSESILNYQCLDYPSNYSAKMDVFYPKQTSFFVKLRNGLIEIYDHEAKPLLLIKRKMGQVEKTGLEAFIGEQIYAIGMEFEAHRVGMSANQNGKEIASLNAELKSTGLSLSVLDPERRMTWKCGIFEQSRFLTCGQSSSTEENFAISARVLGESFRMDQRLTIRVEDSRKEVTNEISKSYNSVKNSLALLWEDFKLNLDRSLMDQKLGLDFDNDLLQDGEIFLQLYYKALHLEKVHLLVLNGSKLLFTDEVLDYLNVIKQLLDQEEKLAYLLQTCEHYLGVVWIPIEDLFVRLEQLAKVPRLQLAATKLVQLLSEAAVAHVQEYNSLLDEVRRETQRWNAQNLYQSLVGRHWVPLTEEELNMPIEGVFRKPTLLARHLLKDIVVKFRSLCELMAKWHENWQYNRVLGAHLLNETIHESMDYAKWLDNQFLPHVSQNFAYLLTQMISA